MRIQSKLIPVVGLAVIAGMTAHARSALLVYEPFDYTAAETITNKTATGTGLTGTWSGSSNDQVASSSLSYGALQTSAGRLLASPVSGNGDVSVPLTSAVQAALTPANGQTTTFWISFIFSPDLTVIPAAASEAFGRPRRERRHPRMASMPALPGKPAGVSKPGIRLSQTPPR